MYSREIYLVKILHNCKTNDACTLQSGCDTNAGLAFVGIAIFFGGM